MPKNKTTDARTDHRITQIRIDHRDGPDFALVDFDYDPNDGRDTAEVNVYHSPLTFGWGPDRAVRFGFTRLYGDPYNDDPDEQAQAFAELRDRAVAFANAALELAHGYAVSMDELQQRYDARLDPELLRAIADDEDDDD